MLHFRCHLSKLVLGPPKFSLSTAAPDPGRSWRREARLLVHNDQRKEGRFLIVMKNLFSNTVFSFPLENFFARLLGSKLFSSQD